MTNEVVIVIVIVFYKH